ncbi:MAG: glycoside hydrolase family 38 C-terminal domain-containing protein [Vulcanisaeta sp.]
MTDIFMRDVNGVRVKLFYLEAASIMGVDTINLEACGGSLCGVAVVRDFGEPWLYFDVIGEGTLRVGDLQFAVFSYGGEGESRWVKVSPGKLSLSLTLSPVRMFGERRVSFNGAYIVYREPTLFNFVLRAKLLLDVAEASDELRHDYLEILNRALDVVPLGSIANWQLEFAIKAHVVDPPGFVRAIFDYYDAKELTHMEPPNFDELRRSAQEGLKVLEDGIRELRIRRGHRGIVYVAGHAHIDLGWLWSRDVTREKVKRTIINVLSLLQSYPELIFLVSNMAYIKWLKDEGGELWGKVKDAVKAGKVIPVGGMWVESDVNLPGGESLVRQLLYGQRFLLREFGSITEVGWLPDTFGFPASLPQILRKAGIKVFFEHKMYWNTVNKFPYSVFLWEGVDGSVIPTVNYATYGADLTPRQITRAWADHTSPELPAFLPFGKGDGGGGPTWLMLERYRAYNDLPGLPRLIMSDLRDFVNTLSNDNSLPRWRGELYLEIHRGVYTNGIRLKQLVRRLETRLRELEMWSVVANIRKNYEELWYPLLEAEYHDPMGATSTKAVYEEVINELEDDLKRVESELINTLRNILGSGPYISVVNSLPWSRRELVITKEPLKGLPMQRVDDGYLVLVEVPALGFKSFEPGDGVSSGDVRAGDNYIENSIIKVVFDSSLKVFDKEGNRWAVVDGYLMACEDMPSRWDGWDIDAYYRRVCWRLEPGDVRVVENGPLRGCIEVHYRFRRSSVKQRICVTAFNRRVDVYNDVDWRERLTLLKAVHKLGIFGHNASFEIPYGVIDRPTRPSNSWEVAKFEVPALRWVDVWDPDYGVAIINDGRQGYSVEENVLSITLLRSPIYPNPFLDYGHSNFVYAIYPHMGDWREAQVPRRAYEFNQPLITIYGTENKEASYIEISNPAIMLEVLKWGEDSGVVMRLYETYGMNACTDVKGFLGDKAVEVDLLELNKYGDVNTSKVCLKPYEIKTLLFSKS